MHAVIAGLLLLGQTLAAPGFEVVSIKQAVFPNDAYFDGFIPKGFV